MTTARTILNPSRVIIQPEAFNASAVRTASVTSKEPNVWQQMLDLGYDQWRQVNQTATDPKQRWDYRDMLDWVAGTYGEVVKLFIMLGKFNQQVENGGHTQYFDNGYASGDVGCLKRHDVECPLHQNLVELFQKYGFHQLPKGEHVLGILLDFKVSDGGDAPESWGEDEETDQERSEGGVEIADELDARYYEVNAEFCAAVEQLAARWKETGTQTLPATQPEAPAPAPSAPVTPRPKVKLLGQNGNAYAILGAASAAMKKAGLSSDTIKEYRERALGGDFDHLLRVTMEYCDVS